MNRPPKNLVFYTSTDQTQVLFMLPQRKSNRLEFYDYNKSGAYFVTICTANRIPVLAEIRRGTETEPVMHTLLPCGIAAVSVIDKLTERFPIHLSAYVVMPDHIHLLFWLTDDQPELRAIHESPLQDNRYDYRKSEHLHNQHDACSLKTDHSMVSKVIGYLKMNVTKTVRQKYPDLQVWQRGYYDHVIRNKDDFRQTALYIRNNPLKWAYDKKIIF